MAITAPLDNASFAAPATFDIAVTAATTSGTISKLDFYDGTTLLGTINIGVADASAVFNLPGVAAGSHVYTVKAGFGTTKGLQLIGDLAEVSVVRSTIDGDLVFSVQMIRDGDGVWRIDGF